MAYHYSYDEEVKEIAPPKLQTNRSMWKLILFTILTLGVYEIVFFIPFSFDLDRVAPKADHTKTMNFLAAWLLSIFTFNIVMSIWHYWIAERIEYALAQRNISYKFGTSTFWRWEILGSFILVGHFVYLYKLCKAMNLLCSDYNEKNGLGAK